ncbi:hypothetical protein R1sor_006245 [Riccia sorocarpa]|uniref:Uncharacterized protein n=1 Tax=Riccia sorocarpa TaxID=122646 RepID=A0ABD3HQI0_9MARC
MMVESKLRQVPQSTGWISNSAAPQNIPTPALNIGSTSNTAVDRTPRQQTIQQHQDYANKGKGLMEKDFPPLISNPAGLVRRQLQKEAPKEPPTVLTPAEQRKKHQEHARMARERRDMAWRTATNSLDCTTAERKNTGQAEKDDGFTAAKGPKYTKKPGRIIPVGNRFESLLEDSDEEEEPIPTQPLSVTQDTAEAENRHTRKVSQENLHYTIQEQTATNHQLATSPTDLTGHADMEVAKEKRKWENANKSGKPQGPAVSNHTSTLVGKQQGEVVAQKPPQ